jgi:hypothetical protein
MNVGGVAAKNNDAIGEKYGFFAIDGADIDAMGIYPSRADRMPS